MTAPRKGDATLEAETERHNAARPDRGQADDGKSGGEVNRGAPGNSQFGSRAGGSASAGESERDAPGSTDKQADNTK